MKKKMKWLKRSCCVLMVLMLAFSMVACTSSANPSSSKTSSSTAKIEDQVVIGDWGGVWNDMAKTEVYAPFNKLYPNTKILSDFPGSSGAILAQLEAQKTSPQMDVALMTELMTVKAISSGLLEKLDKTKVPELSNVTDNARLGDYGPAVLMGEVGIAYNPKLVATPPKSWADLLKPEYKGKIALPNISNTSAILFLCQVAKNNGGSESNINPGFDFMRKLKSNVVTTYSGDADIQQMFERQEVAIAVWWNGPALSAKQNGLDINYVRPSDGAPAVRSFINVVKNCPHPNAAYRMVAQYISKQAQQGVVNDVNYGPTNKYVTVPESKKAFIATGDDLKKLTNFDWGKIADNSNSWTDTWNKIFG